MFSEYGDVVTVSELAKMLSIGRNTAYELLKGNQIRHVKVGRKYIVPKSAVIDFATGACYNHGQIINGRQFQQSSKGETL